MCDISRPDRSVDFGPGYNDDEDQALVDSGDLTEVDCADLVAVEAAGLVLVVLYYNNNQAEKKEAFRNFLMAI
ncbi:hypothetical protein BgiMline_029596, partial [Biomphalaria glabrata]